MNDNELNFYEGIKSTIDNIKIKITQFLKILLITDYLCQILIRFTFH